MDQMKLNKMLVKLFSEDPDKKTKTIRDLAVESLYSAVDDYCTWYVEQGLYLPPDYAKDPTGWNEVLNQIKRAFKILNDQMETNDNVPDMDARVELTDQEKEAVETGLTLFGKYLYYLTDEIKDRGPAHG